MLMFCRCCLAAMQDLDHCPECGCEEYEEREDCPLRHPSND